MVNLKICIPDADYTWGDRLFAHKKSVVLPVYSCLSLWPTTPQNARPVVTPIDSFLKKKNINNEIIIIMTLMMIRMTMIFFMIRIMLIKISA